jgi:hypothetical protein
MLKGDAMHALSRALIVSRMHGARRTDVAGLPGVSVSFDGTAESPRRLYVVLPNGNETFTDIVGESDEEFAEDAARYLGLA